MRIIREGKRQELVKNAFYNEDKTTITVYERTPIVYTRLRPSTQISKDCTWQIDKNSPYGGYFIDKNNKKIEGPYYSSKEAFSTRYKDTDIEVAKYNKEHN